MKDLPIAIISMCNSLYSCRSNSWRDEITKFRWASCSASFSKYFC